MIVTEAATTGIMLGRVLLGLLLILIVDCVRKAYRLWINIKICRAHEIQTIIIPLDPLSILGTIFNDPLHLLLNRLPSSLQPACTPYLQRGWFYFDKYGSWQRLGPVWALCSPQGIHVHVADPAAGLEILERRDRASTGDGFVRPAENYQILATFGPCLSTADNANWPRHRKVLAAPFNENVMHDTWTESLKQALGLVKDWEHASEVTTVASDLRTLSLNVLAGAGFKRSVDFKSKMTSSTQHNNEPMGYRDALQTVLDNVILIMLIPRKWLGELAFSDSLKHVSRAATAFEEHMVHMLAEEEKLMKEGLKGTGGIMTALVRALNTTPDQSSKVPRGLSRDEVYGNIFVVNFAGHDTTANTLAFAVLLLTAHPEIQAWVAEEIQRYAGENDPALWEYIHLYPLLKRIRAVMLETLRLFPPIGLLPKRTTTKAQTLGLSQGYETGKQISIPPNAIVNVGILAVQTMPEIWGPDAHKWRPDRWMIASDTLDREALKDPQLGSFLPWSGGPQNCPGTKFSEVEFVAVISAILFRHRLEAVPLPQESKEDTHKRVMDVVKDVDVQMLQKIKHGDLVKVRLQPR